MNLSDNCINYSFNSFLNFSIIDKKKIILDCDYLGIIKLQNEENNIVKNLETNILNTENNKIKPKINKFIYKIINEDGYVNGIDTLEIGLNKHINIDFKGGNKGGWFQYDPRDFSCYYPEYIVNPFFWNKETIGLSNSINLDKGLYFHNYFGVKKNSIQPYVNKNNPSIFESCLAYYNLENKYPFGLSIILQKMNEGNMKDNKWTIENNMQKESLFTYKSQQVLKKHIKNISKYTDSCTSIFSIRNNKNEEINGSCCISLFDTEKDKKAIIKKWSFQILKRFIINNYKKKYNEIFFHIGTPSYLYKEYNSSNNVFEKDLIPFFCDFYINFDILGWCIPLFFSFYFNNINKENNYFICGLKGNRKIQKKYIPEETEG